MKIEYKNLSGAIWEARLNNQALALITVNTSDNSFDLEEGETKIIVRDRTCSDTLIPGSPFESMNLAKAAIEYHFRDLLDKRTEYELTQ